jgi:two-component system, cell cycle sensor histidine kinase and response regulator CckA
MEKQENENPLRVLGAGVERPTGWVRGSILAAAAGYTLVGGAGRLSGWAGHPRDLLAAAVFWALFLLARTRPRSAFFWAVVVIHADLFKSITEVPHFLSDAVLAFPTMTLLVGLVLGGEVALALGLADSALAPLAFLLGNGDFRARFAAFDSETWVDLVAFVVVTAGTGVITRQALKAYGEAFGQSERARRRWSDLFEHAPDGMVALDRDGRITALNGLAQRMLGRTQQQLLGAPLDQALQAAGASVRIDLAGAREGRPVELDLGTSGERRVLEIQARGDPSGTAGARVVVLRDVTQRRALEEQLRHSQRMESVGQLAGGVAHDFNNLLTAVGGNASMLLEHPDPEVREMAADIQQAQQRGASLTRQLLAFARREVRAPEPVELADAAEQLRRLLERLLGERHPLQLQRTGAAWVFADRTQLEQTLLNLVTNARDALPQGGPVAVSIRRLQAHEAQALGSTLELAGSQVVLEVADQGVGMTAQVRERIFEPFFTTKPRGKGTGLGLATVHGIVVQSGGCVAVETAPGAGCKVRVFLPAVEPPPPAEDAAARAQPPGGSERILLVEDNPQVRALVMRVLGKAGYAIIATPDGHSALGLCARSNDFELLLTDVVMPGLTGPELAARLVEGKPGLPVVFMSGYFELPQAEAGSLEPGRNLLRKPFEPEELLRIVRSALGPRK